MLLNNGTPMVAPRQLAGTGSWITALAASSVRASGLPQCQHAGSGSWIMALAAPCVRGCLVGITEFASTYG